jgi:putative ABC transport system substrate-binding protein
MRRREFVALLGAAVLWPSGARAQAAMPVVGWLSSVTPAGLSAAVRAWRLGLQETGYVEGRNVAVEYRWAAEKYERLPQLAEELVRVDVAVIAAAGNSAARAARNATASIPIVFHTGDDPIAVGLVDSISRPGGNMTGVTAMAGELPRKRLELLHELVPARRIAAILNPNNVNGETDAAALRSAARELGVELDLLSAGTPDEIEAAFASISSNRAGGVLVNTDAFLTNQRDQLVGLAARYRVPAIYSSSEFTLAGGLLSYGADREDTFRQVGAYVGRILRGENAAELPVQQPTRFALVINSKTAKALGLMVPALLLARADEVIE